MGFVKTAQPCPCGKSSDAYAINHDGSGKCFSCDKFFPSKGSSMEVASYDDIKQTFRGISPATFKKYGVTYGLGEDGKPVTVNFPYGNGHTKIRFLADKQFKTAGEIERNTGYLFGMDKFPKNSSKAITITEGEFDAMAAFEIFGGRYPVVSVSSAGAAYKDISQDIDYLNTYDKIYLCFDSDEPGQKALQKVAGLFDFNKVYHVKMDQFKDANDYLRNHKKDDFIKEWWAAKRFLPEGVISSYSEFDEIIDAASDVESVSYPFETLNDMTYGIRTGEVVLLTALEGVGKTEIVRSIEHHLLKTTENSIGVIHLEESKSRILKGFAGYELKVPAHLPDTTVSNEDIKKALRQATGSDERLHIYTHFGSDDPDIILNTIRFMVGPCKCKYVFLDHITMAVTGLEEQDERRVLDYLSTQLATMAEDLDFALILVSHVNDEGKTRGSRNISKVASTWIHLDRDITSDSLQVRNTTDLTIRKNRFAGQTGPAGSLLFDAGTFMLEEQMDLPH